MVEAKKFIYAQCFDGLPKVTDFELQSETLPELNDGEVLAEALVLSVDPYMYPYMQLYPIGVTMIGLQVAKILESKHSGFAEGDIVCGPFGWRTHTVFKPADDNGLMRPYILPSFGKLPLSLGLGYLGMPGNAAHFGLLDICKPQPGEIVVVSAAAGAVGSLVGQIAKLKGCKVIGLTGSDEKCTWIHEELGFDHAINYKTADILAELEEAAPDGVDCFFDTVGGPTSSLIIHKMRDLGRIAVGGSIAAYNKPMSDWPMVPMPQSDFLFKQLTMRGFLIWGHTDKWLERIEDIREWIDGGKIRCHETITKGFENMPQALIDMLEGKNMGKAVVEV